MLFILFVFRSYSIQWKPPIKITHHSQYEVIVVLNYVTLRNLDSVRIHFKKSVFHSPTALALDIGKDTTGFRDLEKTIDPFENSLNY